MNQNFCHMPRQFVAFVALVVSILAGCGPPPAEQLQICPGKGSVAESLSALELRNENIMPVKANGQCRLQYWAEEKQHKENFPVRLWVQPPGQVRLQGDVAWDPKGIILGSNESEFWLAIKPKEISSYWWGQWSEQDCSERLIISPKQVLEAMGIAEVGGEGDWSLSNEEFFDVLTKRDAEGSVSRKIYIYSCDYTVRKIEYFDVYDEASIVMELSRYKEIAEGFFAPSVIEITNYGSDDNDEPVTITLKLRSMRAAEFNEKLQKRLFARPQPRGFEHIYKIVSGEAIEQSQ